MDWLLPAYFAPALRRLAFNGREGRGNDFRRKTESFQHFYRISLRAGAGAQPVIEEALDGGIFLEVEQLEA